MAVDVEEEVGGLGDGCTATEEEDDDEDDEDDDDEADTELSDDWAIMPDMSVGVGL